MISPWPLICAIAGRLMKSPWPLATPADLAGSVNAFHQAHQAQYAHSDTAAVPEIVNLRLTAIGRLPKPRPAETPGGGGAPTTTDRVYLDDWAEIAVFARADIAVDAALAGPLLVEDQHTSLFIPPAGPCAGLPAAP